MASLLEQLGGTDALAVVVAGLVARLRADPRLASKLDGLACARHETHMVDYFAALLDNDRGPQGAPDTSVIRSLFRTGEVKYDDFLRYLADTLSAAGVGDLLSHQVVRQIACGRWGLVWILF